MKGSRETLCDACGGPATGDRVPAKRGARAGR
ncbi:hypothetical protein EES46_14260 [Streptomyces sp. ADI98-10]|nr:hypothetical protein EES46_14260 [Streptomyces sp. ADI98-10]